MFEELDDPASVEVIIQNFFQIHNHKESLNHFILNTR